MYTTYIDIDNKRFEVDFTVRTSYVNPIDSGFIPDIFMVNCLDGNKSERWDAEDYLVEQIKNDIEVKKYVENECLHSFTKGE